jgi:predicted nucleic acid-binding protein
LIVYAESSAVVAWLFHESAAAAVRKLLANSETVVTSDLTLIECDRTIIRASGRAEMTVRNAARRRGVLNAAAAHWVLLRIDQAVVEGSRRPFPHEPLRSLDAIHLASAIIARSAVPEIALLSLDDRIRANGRALGFPLLPRD